MRWFASYTYVCSISVVILAEDSLIQNRLADEGIFVQTIPEVSPIKVYPARVLSEIYALLGKTGAVNSPNIFFLKLDGRLLTNLPWVQLQ